MVDDIAARCRVVRFKLKGDSQWFYIARIGGEWRVEPA